MVYTCWVGWLSPLPSPEIWPDTAAATPEGRAAARDARLFATVSARSVRALPKFWKRSWGRSVTDYLVPVGLIVLGFGLLTAGGELLVRGASRLAAAVGVSPLVIGLTVVALGTSAPEMAVTLRSSLQGKADLAVGNVVGSNICNVLLILGLSALAAPIAVSVRLIRWDVPLMILASVLCYVLGLSGQISRGGGALLFCGLVSYVAWAVVQSRKESREVQLEYAREYGTESNSRSEKAGVQVALIVVGLILLTLGSHWLILGSVAIARLLGVSELLIGLTILAVGTSLPELAASVIASLRGERDIAVGNVVGSNLFNILGVLGLSALLSPKGIAISNVAIRFDIPVMVAVAVACLPIFFSGHRITRWEGGLLLAYYLAYTVYLILGATNEDLSHSLGQAMLAFVVPLTVVTLALDVIRTLRSGVTSGGDDSTAPCPACGAAADNPTGRSVS